VGRGCSTSGVVRRALPIVDCAGEIGGRTTCSAADPDHRMAGDQQGPRSASLPRAATPRPLIGTVAFTSRNTGARSRGPSTGSCPQRLQLGGVREYALEGSVFVAGA
jgi:glycerol kinase